MRLHDFFDYYARETPDAEFAIQGERTLHYGEAQAEANRVAHALLAAGLGKGDRVGFLAKNSIEFVVFYFACSKVGVVPVPLNYRLAPPEWAFILGDAGARLVVARGELASALDSARADLTKVDTLVALEASPPAGWVSWNEWIAGQPTHNPPDEVLPEDDVYQMYTSGTTGRPKGAVLQQGAIMANVQQAGVIFEASSGERVLVVAPVYHAAAAVTVFMGVAKGAALLIHEDFDPAAVVHALSEERVATVTLVPAMIQACLVMVPDVAERNYDGLQKIVYGASPIAEETLRQAMAAFGCGFVQGYGMTETTAVLTYLMEADHRAALEGRPELLLAAGRPLVGTRLKIIDENGEEVPPGTVGEICGRGPQLMRGYWNLPEASAEALRDGWMHTGDAGSIDADGYLFIQDRVKDMIVSGGENVYPREVEEVLFGHPAVADAAVIGVPSERWGEEIKAVIVVKAGEQVSAEDIVDYCKGRLGGYKRPRSVDFLPELPRNPSGKVLKRELREPYWKGHSRRVS